MVGEEKIVACRYCGEPIRFIRTPKGRQMPCDAEPVTMGFTQGAGNTRIVLESGVVLVGRDAGADAPMRVTGYTPHWDSCPGAQTARRREHAHR